MSNLGIGSSVEFKPTSGLGGWRPGTVTGYVGRLIEVTDGRSTWCVKPSQVREPRADLTTYGKGRVAQQAEMRAKLAEGRREEVAADLVRRSRRTPGGAVMRGRCLACTDMGCDGMPCRNANGLDRFFGAVPDLPEPTAEFEAERTADIQRDLEAEGYTFDPIPSKPKTRPIAPQPKAPKPTRSAAFLKWTRMQACAITGDPAEVAHHYENAGRGRKCSDYMTVPLTDAAHRGWHDASDAWLAHAGESARARGESYDLIATRLAMAETGWRALVAFLERQDEEMRRP